jgi:peptide/nickel transport system ATP-binding protein
MTEPLLSISGLSAVSDRDGGAPILRDVALTLERGEVRGLVGESGAGKSTIAKALLGILPRSVRITGGSLRFEGKDLLTLPAHALRDIMGNEISLIPQDPQTALNPGRRIEAQLTDGLRLKRGMSAKAARARALTLMEEVHIREPERVLRAYPHELSGGMRQRVALARSLAQDRQLLLMDEPFAALDAITRDLLHDELERIWKETGRTIVFVTHNVREAVRLGQRVLLLSSRPGRVVQEWEVTEEHRTDAGLAGQLTGVITARLREEIRRHAK